MMFMDDGAQKHEHGCLFIRQEEAVGVNSAAPPAFVVEIGYSGFAQRSSVTIYRSSPDFRRPASTMAWKACRQFQPGFSAACACVFVRRRSRRIAVRRQRHIPHTPPEHGAATMKPPAAHNALSSSAAEGQPAAAAETVPKNSPQSRAGDCSGTALWPPSAVRTGRGNQGGTRWTHGSRSSVN